ncbi:hypothetical protein DIE08_32780 [Burkholderia sp. Bp9004]|nr:hypothetical protein DIE08_32780 [Burkholderia sp. Bp9004]
MQTTMQDMCHQTDPWHSAAPPRRKFNDLGSIDRRVSTIVFNKNMTIIDRNRRPYHVACCATKIRPQENRHTGDVLADLHNSDDMLVSDSGGPAFR